VSPTSATVPAASATIAMGTFSFTGLTSVSIKAGQSVLFKDPGGTHNLVTGTQGTFAAEPGAPDGFSSASGITFSPGDSKTITFPTAGTYHITCTIHTSMQATITVG
jgi:plastocyanin